MLESKELEDESDREYPQDELYTDSSTDRTRGRQIKESIHNHTQLSDGNDSIHSMIGEAALLGFRYLGFADHWDVTGISDGNHNDRCFDEPFNNVYDSRREAIYEQIEESEDLPPDESIPLDIADGAELDFHPGKEHEMETEIRRADFDYILLSVHYDCEGNDYRCVKPSKPSETADQIVDNYFENIKTAIDFADQTEDIKVISHPDRIETNPFIGDKVRREHYKEVLDYVSQKDVLPELNGKILTRQGETLFYDVLSEMDVDYSVGTDSHRVGSSHKVEWENETLRRILELEDRIEGIGRAPEPVIENLDIPTLNIPRYSKITVDSLPDEYEIESLF